MSEPKVMPLPWAWVPDSQTLELSYNILYCVCHTLKMLFYVQKWDMFLFLARYLWKRLMQIPIVLQTSEPIDFFLTKFIFLACSVAYHSMLRHSLIKSSNTSRENWHVIHWQKCGQEMFSEARACVGATVDFWRRRACELVRFLNNL